MPRRCKGEHMGLSLRRRGKSVTSIGFRSVRGGSPVSWALESFPMPIGAFSDAHQKFFRRASEFHRLPACHRTGLPLVYEPSAFADPFGFTIFTESQNTREIWYNLLVYGVGKYSPSGPCGREGGVTRPCARAPGRGADECAGDGLGLRRCGGAPPPTRQGGREEGRP